MYYRLFTFAFVKAFFGISSCHPSGPEFSAILVINEFGAVKIRFNGTRGFATVTIGPILAVNLPQTDIKEHAN